VVNTQDIQVGDIVYLKWYNSYIVHLVQEIQGSSRPRLVQRIYKY
jgi:hypothetical protein